MEARLSQDSKDSKSKHQQHRDQMLIISELLGVSGSPEDELSALEDSRLSGSCEWLTNKNTFQDWQFLDDSPRYFWLTGRPGTGKSTLAGHVVNYLGDSRCSYYFFKYKDYQRSSLSSFLRSIAYQMAKSSHSVREKLIEISVETSHLDKNDFRSLWRKLFVGGIFRASLPHM